MEEPLRHTHVEKADPGYGATGGGEGGGGVTFVAFFSQRLGVTRASEPPFPLRC